MFTSVRIDATEDEGYARFLNDNNRNPNLTVKLHFVDGHMRPVFVTNRKIKAGTELCYNYGPMMPTYFWRKKDYSKKQLLKKS